MNEKTLKEYDNCLSIEEIVPILRDISIFGGLSDEQLQNTCKHLKKVPYAKDEIVFREGDQPSHIYIIKNGRIKIVKSIDETPLEIITFEIGQCFGETSVIGIKPHAATAVAIEDAELIVLSRQALMTFFQSDKELFSILILNIAREACRRLYKTDEILLHYVLNK
ncbi:MAG: hypothetical protein ACD_79C00291G0004 [uncultured bacterium]|nr:MAG: hypothetical protein ACD_79C00291G0004 [uncultured bacterium]